MKTRHKTILYIVAMLVAYVVVPKEFRNWVVGLFAWGLFLSFVVLFLKGSNSYKSELNSADRYEVAEQIRCEKYEEENQQIF